MPLTAIVTYTRRKLEPAFPDPEPIMIAVQIKAAPSATVEYAAGTVLGRVTATGKYAIYDPAAFDGTEVAEVILAYDISVDTSGLLVFTTTAGAVSEVGVKARDVGAYAHAALWGKDLKQSGTGSLDAGAAEDLNGRWVGGGLTSTTGFFLF